MRYVGPGRGPGGHDVRASRPCSDRRATCSAEQQDTQLALIGDVIQLGSVEAGRAFGQLRQAGMPTFVLDEIVRQTKEAQKAAVEASIRTDAAAA